MKVAFFPGCMVDVLYPEVGIAAVNVLEKLGCEVELPDDQVCCGQPFSNSGYIEEAKPMVTTPSFRSLAPALGRSRPSILIFLPMMPSTARKSLI